jgi:hypothetical protein
MISSSQRPVPIQDNTTYKHKDKHPCLQPDSNPRSQQPRGQDLRNRAATGIGFYNRYIKITLHVDTKYYSMARTQLKIRFSETWVVTHTARAAQILRLYQSVCYTAANLYLRSWAVGNSVQFNHRDTAAVPVQDTKNNLKCAMVYQQHYDT